MRCYKLTTQKMTTQGNTVWGEGVTHTPKESDGGLCSGAVIHAYTHPLLAVLLNPIHADITKPILWEAEGHGEMLNDHGLKIGFRGGLTTIRQIPLPVVTTEMRVRFAILCAKEVYSDKAWNAWADKWLSGEDRSGDAAHTAARAAAARSVAAAAWDAAYAAARAAAYARAHIDLIAIAEIACAEVPR